MGWIRRMRLKNALFTMMFLALLLASALSIGAFIGCTQLGRSLSGGGISMDFSTDPPVVIDLPKPPDWVWTVSRLLGLLQIVLPILIFTAVILVASTLFYRVKLREPLQLLQNGAERIMENDLDFEIPPPPGQDELGQLCSAFEKMRKTLLANNRTLWRQAEERKRLNAAFAHDLRNPVTVLKGTAKLLRKGIHDESTIGRLENYTLRIEQYIESMSGIQRLEQMPVRKKAVAWELLYAELVETVRLLAPELSCRVTVPGDGSAEIDHDLFMTVAENLIANGARYARRGLEVSLEKKDPFLLLSVTDDGPGFPDELIRNGPKPFGKAGEPARDSGTAAGHAGPSGLSAGKADSSDPSAGKTVHFGMGLYICQTICLKHGGRLELENIEGRGAKAAAYFQSYSWNIFKTLSVS